MSLISGIRAWIGRRAERELDDELQFHLAQQVDEYMAAGMPPSEAEQAARRALGGMALVKEECREARGGNWLVDALRDVRYALRTMGRSPGFTAAAVVTLALGIGANTAVFSIADAVLLKMLPVRDPQRLFVLAFGSVYGRTNSGTSFINYREIQTAGARFADFAAEARAGRTQAVVNHHEEPVRRSSVSGNYFELLGVRAALGRTFEASFDDELGRHPEAVISHGFWRRRFNLDPAVLGSTIQFGNDVFRITGVAEPGFSGLEVGTMTDVWTPVVMSPERQLRARGMVLLRIIARAKPGVRAEQVRGPLLAWYRQMQIEWARSAAGLPANFLDRLTKLDLQVLPAARGISALRERYGEPIQIVFAVVAVILLLACGNVANLLLARAGARQHEMAVRASVGAGRTRLIRQLLTESILPALAAAALGACAARFATPALVTMLAPSDAPVQLAVGLDGRVLAFTAMVSILTAIAFGVVPAMHATRVDVHAALKSAGRPVWGRRPVWQGRSLIAVQMALSLVLLAGASLFVRTLVNLRALDPGFDRHNVLLAEVAYSGGENNHRVVLSWQELLRRAQTIPGVESASVSIGGPFAGASMSGPVRILGDTGPARLDPNQFVAVSSRFFDTFGGRLIEGRDFEPRDFEDGAGRVAIVNETMKRRYFGSANAIGRQFSMFGDPPHWIEIIGVASDMKFDSLRTAAPAIIYEPFPVFGGAPKLMSLELRAHRDTLAVAPVLRREATAANAGFTLQELVPHSKQIDDTLIRERLLATVGTFLGIVALLLTALGLYGTVGYAVSRRTQEIGIRMALGARQGQVVWMILGEALTPVVAGGAAGVAAAIWTGRLVSGLLFGIRPQDPGAILVPAGMLLATSLAAAFVPALRACRTAPVQALRNE